jgi:beta-galactosidase
VQLLRNSGNNNERMKQLFTFYFSLFSLFLYAQETLPVINLTPPVTKVNGNINFSQSLNGEWKYFNTVPAGCLFTAADASAINWYNFIAPGFAPENGSPYMEAGLGSKLLLYKKFTPSAICNGRRVHLRFESIIGLCRFYLNGKLIDTVETSFLPVELDITNHLLVNQPNHLFVKVERSAMCQWSGRDIGQVGGDVQLLALPQQYISRLQVESDFDNNNGTITAIINITNQHKTSSPAAVCNFRLYDKKGNTIPVTNSRLAVPVLKPLQTFSDTIQLQCKQILAWEPEHPNLYKLYASLGTSMEVVRTIGFRTVKIDGNKMLVNNKIIKLRGAVYHGSRRGKGVIPSNDETRSDVQLMKYLNVNALRPNPCPTKAYIDACNELGFWTNAEAIIGGMIYEKGLRGNNGNDSTLTQPYLGYIARLVETYRSEPCVLFYGLGNENFYHDYFQKAAFAIKAIESTRPVTSNSDLKHGVDKPGLDINDDHYPRGPSVNNVITPATCSIDSLGNVHGWEHYPTNKPFIATEWCHTNHNNINEMNLDPGVDNYWGNYLQTHINYTYNNDYMLGGFIFLVNPHRPLARKLDWKAVLEDDRSNENAMFWQTKKSLSPVYLLKARVQNNTAYFTIHNRYNFSNLNELKIQYHHGGDSGWVTSANVPAMQQGTIAVTLKKYDPLEEVLLSFYDKKGLFIDRHAIHPQTDALPVTRVSDIKKLQPVFTEDTAVYKISSGNFCFTIHKKTGWLQAYHKTEKIINGGANLVVRQSGFKHWDVSINQPVLNKCTDWKTDTVFYQSSDVEHSITVKGNYKQASGSFTYRFDTAFHILYDFVYTDTTAVDAFETGINLRVYDNIEKLEWIAKPQWSWLPQHQTGRYRGVAFKIPHRYKDNNWGHTNYFNNTTRDYQATRFNFKEAALTDFSGYGFYIHANGRQHIRITNEGNAQLVSISDFHNGGTEGHLIKSLRMEKKTVNKGTVLKGMCSIRLF